MWRQSRRHHLRGHRQDQRVNNGLDWFTHKKSSTQKENALFWLFDLMIGYQAPLQETLEKSGVFLWARVLREHWITRGGAPTLLQGRECCEWRRRPLFESYLLPLSETQGFHFFF